MQEDRLLHDIKNGKDTGLFESLLESLPALVRMSDIDMACVWFNRGWLSFTGRTMEQELGDGWMNIVHPEDRERCIATYTENFAARTPYQLRYRLRHHSGEYRWILDRGAPRYNEAGAFAGYTGACLDIHDKHIALQTLQESENRWKALTEAMPQLVWICNGDDGFCMYLSKQWEVYTGTPVDHLMGFEWLKLMHPFDRELSARVWKDASLGKTDYDMEYRIRRADGVYRWFKVRGVPIKDSTGKVIKWYGTCTDIQDLVDAKNVIEAANNAKSEFVANISHELRTPLGAVIGISNILGQLEPLTDEQRKYISTLQSASKSLLSVVNDLLDFSKISAQAMELESIPFCVFQMIQDTISMITPQAEEKNLSLHIDVKNPDMDHKMFMGDPSRFRQIVTNLCGNAVKFTHEGGVSISLDCEEIVPGDTERVIIKVTDTGIGIPKDKHAAIFEKFVQVDSSVTRKYGGTGLGLPICKNLAKMMGGDISLDSEPGKGSTFTFFADLKIASAAGRLKTG